MPTISHKDIAEAYVQSGERNNSVLYSTLAGAHAVLALIDIITGDREEEIEDANTRIIELEGENKNLRQQRDLARLRVRELANQLDGCNDTVRKHEQAAANEKAATNNDLRKSYE